MDKECKILLGKILGEIYELQGNNCEELQGTIYGLKNGFEFVLDDVINKDYKITTEEYKRFLKIIDEIALNQDKLRDFKGYYDIEEKLTAIGICRDKAIYLFTYLSKNRQYPTIIKKLNSHHSPSELTTF